MSNYIKEILLRSQNVHSILSQIMIEDEIYYLMKWTNKSMPQSWISHEVFEAEIEKVKQ